MDRASNLGSAVVRAGSTSGASGLAAARALEKHIDRLQFPGEDGGHSLTAWARRDLEATLQLLADRAQYITGGSGAAIALRDGEQIICRASSGPSAPEVGSYLQVSSGLSGESVRMRKILACDDAAVDARVNHDSCRALGIASFVVMPLVREEEVVGIFEIFSGQPHAFQERDIQALERLGDMVNTALDQVMRPRSKPAVGDGNAQKSLATSMPEKNTRPIAGAPVKPVEATVARIGVPSLETKLVAPKEKSREAEVAATDAEEKVPPKAVAAIGTCASCGFPVSPGRAFCLDCEAALPEKFGNAAPAVSNSTPAFLTDLGEGGAQPSGLKDWIVAHRYLLGTIAVLGGTAALLLFR
jgi:hypothetical protein